MENARRHLQFDGVTVRAQPIARGGLAVRVSPGAKPRLTSLRIER